MRSECQSGRRPAGAVWRRLLVAAAAGWTAVYGINVYQGNVGPFAGVPAAAAAEAPQPKLNRGAMTAFVIKRPPAALPDLAFKDADGQTRKLSQWRGKVVLLNLWATWCAPCRREMPSLDRLNAALKGDDFEVVAVSLDRKGPEVAAEFLAEIGVETLALYIDERARIARDLKSFGLPLTVLVGREGEELGRMAGPAEWDSDEAKALIEAAIAGRLNAGG